VGLAVTEDGAGSLQLVEVVAQRGHGALHRLGLMGTAMKESVKTAYEFVAHRRKAFEIIPEFKDGYDLSVLALQGAIPKEGPSAGLAFAAGIVSALTQRRVRNDVAITGEITLHGNVLGVDGIGQKIAAAKQAGARVVILPKDNEREARELPGYLTDGVRLSFVDHAEDALKDALL
jgi:ATP-dependent Lon protease